MKSIPKTTSLATLKKNPGYSSVFLFCISLKYCKILVLYENQYPLPLLFVITRENNIKKRGDKACEIIGRDYLLPAFYRNRNLTMMANCFLINWLCKLIYVKVSVMLRGKKNSV